MNELFWQYLKECPAVAILRGISDQEIIPVCDALFNAGIRLLEIPLNTPRALEIIAIAVNHCGTRQVVGAGTVLTPEDVNGVKAQGGKFIISPNTDTEVIRETKKCGMISIPGFFTATEGFIATKAGADILKLFPSRLGPEYVKDIQAVIKTPIMAVGGVNAENIPGFMKLCCGVGIGSALYSPGKLVEKVALDAHLIVKAVKQG